MHMTAMVTGMLLIAFLPFLVSLAAQPSIPKMLCLVASVLALLLSAETIAAVLPWAVGMAMAAISVRASTAQRSRARR